MLPRKTSTEGLDEGTVYSHLVLEETASKSQKAFGASGTSVAVGIDLFECMAFLLSCGIQIELFQLVIILVSFAGAPELV